MPTLIAIVLAVLVLIVLGLLTSQVEFRILKSRRSGRGLSSFASAFSGGAPEESLRTIYEYFSESTSVRDFPVLPEDDLAEIYGITGGDLFDDLRELSQQLGVSDLDPLDIAEVRTVADVVELLLGLEPKKLGRLGELGDG